MRYDENGISEEHWDDPRYHKDAFDEPDAEPLTLPNVIGAFAYGQGLMDDEVFPNITVSVCDDRIEVETDAGQKLTIRFELT